jgi:hypothetical protein
MKKKRENPEKKVKMFPHWNAYAYCELTRARDVRAIQILRDTLEGGGETRPCHQITQGGGRGSAKVLRDIFFQKKKIGHFLVLLPVSNT